MKTITTAIFFVLFPVVLAAVLAWDFLVTLFNTVILGKSASEQEDEL